MYQKMLSDFFRAHIPVEHIYIVLNELSEPQNNSAIYAGHCEGNTGRPQVDNSRLS